MNHTFESSQRYKCRDVCAGVSVCGVHSTTSKVNLAGSRLSATEVCLTFQLQANEVGIPQVFQEDAVGRAGLEIERDVGAGLALEGGKVQVG